MNCGRFYPAVSANPDSADLEIRAAAKLGLKVDQTLGYGIRQAQRGTAWRLARCGACSWCLRFFGLTLTSSPLHPFLIHPKILLFADIPAIIRPACHKGCHKTNK
ncbi:hypothetical protein ACFSQ7_30165 [Paenibacillus rhizoplanae]